MPVAKSSLKVRPQQQISDKKLKEILEEDKRRLQSLLATYRPITGENALVSALNVSSRIS